jgi:hypothetical protein
MRSSLLVKSVRKHEMRHLPKEDVFCFIRFVLLCSVLILVGGRHTDTLAFNIQ